MLTGTFYTRRGNTPAAFILNCFCKVYHMLNFWVQVIDFKIHRQGVVPRSRALCIGLSALINPRVTCEVKFSVQNTLRKLSRRNAVACMAFQSWFGFPLLHLDSGRVFVRYAMHTCRLGYRWQQREARYLGVFSSLF